MSLKMTLRTVGYLLSTKLVHCPNSSNSSKTLVTFFFKLLLYMVFLVFLYKLFFMLFYSLSVFSDSTYSSHSLSTRRKSVTVRTTLEFI